MYGDLFVGHEKLKMGLHRNPPVCRTYERFRGRSVEDILRSTDMSIVFLVFELRTIWFESFMPNKIM